MKTTKTKFALWSAIHNFKFERLKFKGDAVEAMLNSYFEFSDANVEIFSALDFNDRTTVIINDYVISVIHDRELIFMAYLKEA